MPMMEGWKPYDFSEPPFLGIIKMLDIQQSWNLYDKVIQNESILKGERSSISLTVLFLPSINAECGVLSRGLGMSCR